MRHTHSYRLLIPPNRVLEQHHVLRSEEEPSRGGGTPGAQILCLFLLQSRRWLRRHVKRSIQKFLANAFFFFVASWSTGLEALDACCATDEVVQIFVCCATFVLSVGPFFSQRGVGFFSGGVRGRAGACGCGHVGAGVSRRWCGCDHVLAGESCLSRDESRAHTRRRQRRRLVFFSLSSF